MTCLGNGWARIASLGKDEDAALDPGAGAITEAAPNAIAVEATEPGVPAPAEGPSPRPEPAGGMERSDTCA